MGCSYMDHQFLKQELLNKTINAKQDCVESEYLQAFLSEFECRNVTSFSFCCFFLFVTKTLDSH